MINIKNKNIIKQIISVLIICELAFSPIAICGQMQNYIQKYDKQIQDIQSTACCCENNAQCPTESESEESCPDNKCRCASYDNIPSLLTSDAMTTFLSQNPYFICEFQIKPLQQNQSIFHPPKQ
jgi:hypothetical protein